MVRILGFHCCGQGLIPLPGTEISQIERPKKKKEYIRYLAQNLAKFSPSGISSCDYNNFLAIACMYAKSLQSCRIQSDSRTE